MWVLLVWFGRLDYPRTTPHIHSHTATVAVIKRMSKPRSARFA